MYDENEYGVESLWSPEMAHYQGNVLSYKLVNCISDINCGSKSTRKIKCKLFAVIVLHTSKSVSVENIRLNRNISFGGDLLRICHHSEQVITKKP